MSETIRVNIADCKVPRGGKLVTPTLDEVGLFDLGVPRSRLDTAHRVEAVDTSDPDTVYVKVLKDMRGDTEYGAILEEEVTKNVCGRCGEEFDPDESPADRFCGYCCKVASR